MALLPLQLGQETHPTGILFPCDRRRCWAVAMGPKGLGGERHGQYSTWDLPRGQGQGKPRQTQILKVGAMARLKAVAWGASPC